MVCVGDTSILTMVYNSMVLVNLVAKLGNFLRANVGVHIPETWFAYGYGKPW